MMGTHEIRLPQSAKYLQLLENWLVAHNQLVQVCNLEKLKSSGVELISHSFFFQKTHMFRGSLRVLGPAMASMGLYGDIGAALNE